MNYDDVKTKIDTLTLEINQKRAQLKQKQTENERVISERQKMQTSFNGTLKMEKSKAFNSFQQEQLGTFDEQLNLFNSKMYLAKQKHESYLATLTVDAIREKFNSECEKFESIKSSLDLIDEKITEILGERFKTELYANLNTGTISLEDADIEVFTLHFDRLLVTLDKIKQPKENPVKEFLLSTVGKINFDKLKDNRLGFYLLTLVLAIVIFFATYLASSFFCVFLIILFCSNLSKSYSVYTSIISYKAVKDNLDVFDKRISEKCQEIYDRQVANENAKYDKFITNLNNKIEETTLQRAEKEASLQDEFKFNDASLRDDFQTQLDNKSAMISQNNSVIEGLKEELTEMNENLNDLNMELSSALRTLQETYLSMEIGEDKKFNPRFLFNFGEDPEFFVHSKQSSAFISETYEVAIDFVRLLCAQIRARMLPNSYSIYIIDTENMGVDFMQFVDEKHANNFRILSDPEQLKKSLEEWETTLKKRNQSMTVKYKTIEAYNDEMLRNASVTESYIFVFAITGFANLITDLKFIKLLSSGGNLGIYLHCMFENEQVLDGTYAIKSIVKQFQSLYLLTESACVLRDAGFLLKSYSDKR